jgi:hypothetical protein
MRDDVVVLFVDARGPYPALVADYYDRARDARTYAGPHPVVAHPPCSRWCRLSKLVEARWNHRVGDDGGCFAAALTAVRTWGGVLEHPAWSRAWAAFGLIVPRALGWHRDLEGGWCCEVSQAAYGHRAKKLTWLYYVGTDPPPPLLWTRPEASAVVGYMKRRADGTIWRNNAKRMPKLEASRTPAAFAEQLVALAAGARRCSEVRVA